MAVERTPELEALIGEVAYQVRVHGGVHDIRPDGGVQGLSDWVVTVIDEALKRPGAEHYRCEFDCSGCHQDCETPNCVCGWEEWVQRDS